MEKQEIFKTLSSYKSILEEKGYNVIYIGLYGSQNYNVDDEFSDIDCKAIVLPSLHDIIFRKVTSKTIELENGAIDVKDLITFYDVIRKGNFSYIESIDTDYFIGDKYIKELFRQIKPNLKSILGAMYEKRKALTHEYPSKHNEFEKWGFDPKQFHHIVRLYDILEMNICFEQLVSYMEYNYDRQRYMVGIKRNKYYFDKQYVENQSDEIIDEAKELIPEDYKYEPVDLSNEVSKYIEDSLKTELNNNGCSYAREVRTFGNNIPKKDLEKFPILREHNGEDISYIVYESVEIL